MKTTLQQTETNTSLRPVFVVKVKDSSPHHYSLLTNTLKSLTAAQSIKGICPPVIAYDSNSRLLKLKFRSSLLVSKSENLDKLSSLESPFYCLSYVSISFSRTTSSTFAFLNISLLS